MIDILSTSDSLCRTFLKSLLDDNNAEVMMEILLEGKDSLALKHVSRVMKYLLCKMKMLEKEDIEDEVMETYQDDFTDSEGKRHVVEKQRPKALSLQLLDIMLGFLPDRAPKAWKTFVYFFEVVLAFALYSPDELKEKRTGE